MLGLQGVHQIDVIPPVAQASRGRYTREPFLSLLMGSVNTGLRRMQYAVSGQTPKKSLIIPMGSVKKRVKICNRLFFRTLKL